jgi:hypothetical protein
MPKAPKKAVEEVKEATQPVVSAEFPLNATHYYVWKDGAFVKMFDNEVYKGEGLKFSKLFADEIGGTVQI